MKRLLIFLALAALIAAPATAGYAFITPASSEITAGDGLPANAYLLVDGSTSTFWSNPGLGTHSYFTWSNPTGYSTSQVRIYGMDVGNIIQCTAGGETISLSQTAGWNVTTFSTPRAGAVTCNFVDLTNPPTYYTVWGRAKEVQFNVTADYIPHSISFNASPTTGNAPLSVSFNQTGNPSSRWVWDFGDTVTVNTTAGGGWVIHEYNASGTYSVTLDAYNATHGWAYASFPNLVTVTNANASQVRTYFQAVDGRDNGAMHGANIYIHDATTNVWSNKTNAFDGTHYIDAPTDHILDASATASGMTDASRFGLTPRDGTIYELIMWPGGIICSTPGLCGGAGDPGLGNINLIVAVNDRESGKALSGVSISTTTSTGAQVTQTSSDAGSAVFVVPNSTTVLVSASKAGYQSATKSVTTSYFGPDTIRIELSQLTVTTVPTLAPGVTATTTLLPGCEDPTSETCMAAEDAQMARDVREWLKLLIPICGLAILMFLFTGRR